MSKSSSSTSLSSRASRWAVPAAAVGVLALAYQLYRKRSQLSSNADGGGWFSFLGGGARKRIVLPTSAVPEHYAIDITPDFVGFSFNGTVVTTIDIPKPTSTIVMHSKEIEFDSASLSYVGCPAPAITTVSVAFDTLAETVTLTFSAPLAAGKAKLTIDYVGELNDRLNGFYRSTYDKDGETRVMGTTQFEATHARQAFPCWDEPLLKAVFEITLRVPKDRQALCNMPIAEEHVDTATGLNVVRFDPTPIVSSYLLAWCIGEFDYLEDTTAEGVVVRVYTQNGKSHQGKFALECAVKTLSFFSEYFAIGYPLPKLDMIAIPDFAAGAMENWGLVTYRETALLYDPASSSAAGKERVAQVVAHELAHQWFGNLVSPSWWSYLWLNEGFATYAGHLAVDNLGVFDDTWGTFVSTCVAAGLSADALATSHPVEVEVYDAGQINEIFDAVSYYKGSSVIRMMASYVGEQAFRRGLQTYLNEKQFACATTEDLWRHVGAASGKPVAKVMHNWITCTGYPYVTASATTSASAPTVVTLALSQARFFAAGDAASKDDTVWSCPVKVLVGVGSDIVTHTLHLDKRSDTFEVALPTGTTTADKWFVKVNDDIEAFYRVKYDDSLLERLTPVLASLSPINRITVQNDASALSSSGTSSTAAFLSLSQGYRGELDYAVWSDLTGSLVKLASMYALTDAPYGDDMKRFMLWLYRDVIATLGWTVRDCDKEKDGQLRALVLNVGGKCGDAGVVATAQKMFAAHCAGTTLIPTDLLSTVLSITLANGGEKEFKQTLKLYDQANMAEVRVRILSVLGAVKDVALLKQVLTMSTGDSVRAQDVCYPIASVANNAIGRPLAWAWMQENWTMLVGKFGGGQFMLTRIISIVLNNFASTQRLDEIVAFFADKDVGAAGCARGVSQAMERVKTQAAWVTRDAADVAAFLATGPWQEK